MHGAVELTEVEISSELSSEISEDIATAKSMHFTRCSEDMNTDYVVNYIHWIQSYTVNYIRWIQSTRYAGYSQLDTLDTVN